jgi:Flp pilus assembly protein TadG
MSTTGPARLRGADLGRASIARADGGRASRARASSGGAGLRDDAGTLTIWMLGLCIAVLFLGGISLDLWRAFAERRELAGVVDAAAVAAGSVIDEAAFRRDGSVRLDPSAASAVACAELRRRTAPPPSCDRVVATADTIEVTASRDVPLTLLRVLLPGERPLRIEVSARVEPRRGAP